MMFLYAKHPVLIITLPSLNASKPSIATCNADTEAVRRQLLLIETEGKDVVMVNHSYGGIPGAGAARGLSKSTRTKDGKAGGVIGLIYMSAIMVPEGMSLLGFLGGHHAPWIRENQVCSRGRNVSPLLRTNICPPYSPPRILARYPTPSRLFTAMSIQILRVG